MDGFGVALDGERERTVDLLEGGEGETRSGDA
jgi:hypothetical protein